MEPSLMYSEHRGVLYSEPCGVLKQGHHPLRGDGSWFCCDKCKTQFEHLSARFQLPVDMKLCHAERVACPCPPRPSILLHLPLAVPAHLNSSVLPCAHEKLMLQLMAVYSFNVRVCPEKLTRLRWMCACAWVGACVGCGAGIRDARGSSCDG